MEEGINDVFTIPTIHSPMNIIHSLMDIIYTPMDIIHTPMDIIIHTPMDIMTRTNRVKSSLKFLLEYAISSALFRIINL